MREFFAVVQDDKIIMRGSGPIGCAFLQQKETNRVVVLSKEEVQRNISNEEILRKEA